VSVVFGDLPPPDAEGRSIIEAAGAEFFAAAAAAVREHGTDWKAVTQAIKTTTGRKGPELFKPLRQALTGAAHGPEMAPLLSLIGAACAAARFEQLSSRA
jgi:glutamyl-tRNA synthetase